ncbi:MAG TPA: VOC family protein [Stellaceae bacterium]|nr:VOC family protein [Stellaceae bacterium]
MIDHVSIAVRDLAASAVIYERFLTPLGMKRVVERADSVGFGKTYPELWLNARPAGPRLPADTGHHVCLRAPDEAAIKAFHKIALEHGCTDAGAPGPRQGAMTGYYGAFIQDKDGNKIEAATFPRKA